MQRPTEPDYCYNYNIGGIDYECFFPTSGSGCHTTNHHNAGFFPDQAVASSPDFVSCLYWLSNLERIKKEEMR